MFGDLHFAKTDFVASVLEAGHLEAVEPVKFLYWPSLKLLPGPPQSFMPKLTVIAVGEKAVTSRLKRLLPPCRCAFVVGVCDAWNWSLVS